MSDVMSIEAEFAEAMAAHGLAPNEIVADGKIHRFDAGDEKRGKKSCYYMLHADGLPAGMFGDWRTDLRETWCAKPERSLTAAERVAHRERIQLARAEAAAERDRIAVAARADAADHWDKRSGGVRSDHPYVEAKGIRPRGAKQMRDQLLIPLRDFDGMLHSLQYIQPGGEKRFKSGGRVAGCFCLVGDEPELGAPILVAEGWATACSLHQATGHTVFAAMNAGNLFAVSKGLRHKYPASTVVLCADDDYSTEGNPGLTKAREAALAVGGGVAVPDFGSARPERATDFNDLHSHAGLDAIRSIVNAAIKEGGGVEAAPADECDIRELTPVGAHHGADGSRDTLGASDEANSGHVPSGFSVTERGVFYEEEDGTPHWICSPLHVRALVRDRASENWGRLLEWNDADGHPHVWAMPMEMLRSDGADMRGELARLGLDIAPGTKARNKLTEYVTCAKPKARGRCVTRTGWHGGAFVFPDRTIGDARERVIFQAESVMRTYSQAGSLEDWKAGVARLCVGNSRLLLAVSASFASMMLEYSGQESGGLNLVGDSSCGKTTALRAACSVFGGKDYMQRWRATSNGLEGLASLHNDTLLVLDELAQVDAREAGEIAYMLANGSGKARAGRSGTARARQTWKLLFLSAGEIGLSQHLQSVGKKTKAGQEVRLVELPADAGAGSGLFEELHGMTGGAELSTAINDAAVRCYGTPAVAFLEALCQERDDIGAWLKDETRRFVDGNLPADASGQAHRVCQRFALIGLAGEYATAAGITGWSEGDALSAAAACFSVWVDGRGGAGNQEKDSILSHVKAFFEAHEESRFSDLGDTSDRPTINRAGFRRTGEHGAEYLVLPEVFKREICAGFEPKSVAKVLVDAGWIRPSPDAKFQRVERLPGKGATRVYVFTSVVWGAQ
jgi:putative DNA primase/helicase